MPLQTKAAKLKKELYVAKQSAKIRAVVGADGAGRGYKKEAQVAKFSS